VGREKIRLLEFSLFSDAIRKKIASGNINKEVNENLHKK